MDSRKPTVLSVLVGGGFSFETKTLLRQFDPGTEFIYLRTDSGGIPGEDGIPAGQSFEVPMFQTVSAPSRLQSARAFHRTFLTCLSVLRTRRVDLLLGIGCSHLVPMLLAARLAGVPSVFIESITRADKLSTTGRIVYRGRLAKHFLVQWPELHARLPGTRLGTIL